MAKQALQGKRLNSFGMDPLQLVVIGLDVDVPEDHELYQLYDERIKKPLVEGTIKDMMRAGVQFAVVIRKYKFTKGTVVWGKPLAADTELPVVVDGRRRTQHSRAANERLEEKKEPLILVPVQTWKGSLRDASLRSIALNEHREDDDILTKARKAKALLDRIKNEEDVAEHFNKEVQVIRGWISLLEANPAVVKAVEAGDIAPSPAIRLAKLPSDHQKAELEDAIAKGETSTAQIIGRVRRRQAESQGKKKGERPGVAPQRRLLTAVRNAIRDNESDLPDSMGSFEQITVGVLNFVLGDGPPPKLIAHVIKDKIEAAKKNQKSQKASAQPAGAKA